MKISRITLGTAQLGMQYGIANITGKPDFNTAIKILKFAWENGITSIDTSPAYGDIEKIIGSFIKSELMDNSENPFIISKLAFQIDKKDLSYDYIYNEIKQSINQSLLDLKIEKIPIYMLHRPSDIYIKKGLIIECLDQIKNEGLIDKIGISIYNLEDIKNALKFKEINAIQVPSNIFDQRLLKSGIFKELKEKSYTIFARSIFLQGLFFLPFEEIPSYLDFAKEPLQRLHKILDDFNLDIVKACLLFVRAFPEIDSLVLGAENITQIKKNLEVLEEKPLSKEFIEKIMEEFSDIPENLVNPSLWNKIE